MNEPVTISPERRQLALDATYELEALSCLIRERASVDTPELRGIGLRVKSLSSVLMAIALGWKPSENEEETRELRSIVHGAETEPE